MRSETETDAPFFSKKLESSKVKLGRDGITLDYGGATQEELEDALKRKVLEDRQKADIQAALRLGRSVLLENSTEESVASVQERRE